MRSENDVKNAGKEQLTLGTLIHHLQNLGFAGVPYDTPVRFDIYSEGIGWPALHEDIYLWKDREGQMHLSLGEDAPPHERA
jgi:hypothetical protein